MRPAGFCGSSDCSGAAAESVGCSVAVGGSDVDVSVAGPLFGWRADRAEPAGFSASASAPAPRLRRRRDGGAVSRAVASAGAASARPESAVAGSVEPVSLRVSAGAGFGVNGVG